MSDSEPPSSHVVSLRPTGGHAALRRAAQARGLSLIALSPWKIVLRGDPDTRAMLQSALAAQMSLFTSPEAVRAAARLVTLDACGLRQAWAIGAGTAAALRRAGIKHVSMPQQMRSEGLFAMPQLQDLRNVTFGLITAPDGREVIVPALQARGATVLRADVYARVPVPLAPRQLQRLRALQQPPWLMISSGRALLEALHAAPENVASILRCARGIAASERIAASAMAMGCTIHAIADSARPADMIAATSR